VNIDLRRLCDGAIGTGSGNGDNETLQAQLVEGLSRGETTQVISGKS